MTNILVVDDIKTNILVAEGYLKGISKEFKIFLTQNPFEVEDIVINEKIDVLFLDIMMPGMSGIEVLEKIRSNNDLKDVQIIMLTSLSDDENFKKSFELGADDYLRKPINVVELQARLNAAIKTRKNTGIIKEMYEHLKSQNTELKELNKTLKETQFHMVQKEKLASIGELAAGVAHEINNPLGYVSSNIETLKNFTDKIKEVLEIYRSSIKELEVGPENPEVKEEVFKKISAAERKYKINFVMEELYPTLKDSAEGVARVSKIVQTLKNFARTGLENEITYNNVSSIIEEALLIVKNESKYTIDINTDLSELPDIKCNRGQIGQVILNILVNAIQAIKAENRSDRGQISITSSRVDSFILIKIIDDGPGIPEEIIGRIFDPFFTTKDVGLGTGLGLSISHDIIVNKHKGALTVQNAINGGTIFDISIPVDLESFENN